jgi:TM2 domain-containing membrane protein YozV
LPKGDSNVSPGLAFVLGFIPGVGAVYNGQYAKGLVHVVIFGSIISILSTGAARGFEPLFGLLIPAFIFYMTFEAYHTAKKRRNGEVVDEFSGLVRTGAARSRFPAAPVLLIAFGVLFLLDNLDILKIGRLIRYWPALLIALGLYLLYERVTEANHERQ